MASNDMTDRIIAGARKQNRTALLEPEAKIICSLFQLPLPKYEVATNRKEAVDFAENLGYPIVLKIVSPDILHKTDAGGVIVGLNSRTEVETGYDQIVANVKAFSKNARVLGVIVQHMVPGGLEVIVGGLRDPQFGAMVMFGLGGIFAEILKDVTFRITSLDEWDARQMIQSIRGYAALTGFRGHQPVDEGAIASTILGVSKIMNENASIDQIDLNPVIVYAHGCSVVDARVVLVENNTSKQIVSS